MKIERDVVHHRVDTARDELCVLMDMSNLL